MCYISFFCPKCRIALCLSTQFVLASNQHLNSSLHLERKDAGKLAGVEGEVETLPNRTYLLISVCGLLRARIQIPRAYVKAI